MRKRSNRRICLPLQPDRNRLKKLVLWLGTTKLAIHVPIHLRVQKIERGHRKAKTRFLWKKKAFLGILFVVPFYNVNIGSFVRPESNSPGCRLLCKNKYSILLYYSSIFYSYHGSITLIYIPLSNELNQCLQNNVWKIKREWRIDGSRST